MTDCGALIVGGFEGPELSPSYRRALQRGERAGAILFSRNIVDLEQVAALNAAIIAAAERPLVAVDQEGGRVARLKPPFVPLPPMRRLGRIDDVALTERAGAVLGAALAAHGFNLNFAPVVDVDSNPQNPVIGDRALGGDPALVGRHGAALVRGLERHLSGCAKHFPGHGDTALDSHHALPRVTASRAELFARELPPFREVIGAGVSSLMSAHVVYPALDPERPATLAPSIVGDLLRRELGFGGVLFSDDLLMAAVAARNDPGGVAIEAVAAGCDLLLVCRHEEIQEDVLEALVREHERSASFRVRVGEAIERGAALRRRHPPAVAEPAVRRQALARGEALARTFEQAHA
jgi:beta-N-acetylhexosaminidase